ncbi:MAG: DUF2752 domain-containing protein [bacterium]
MLKKVLLLVVIFFLLYAFIQLLSNNIFDCIFTKYLNIHCPGCGLTRSFRAILNLDFKTAFNYNYLGIPIFFGIIILFILLIYDVLTFKFTFTKKILDFCDKQYKFILFIIIIMFIINNIKY